jgi:transposase-like protein
MDINRYWSQSIDFKSVYVVQYWVEQEFNLKRDQMLTDKPNLATRTAKRSWKRWYTDAQKLEAVKLYLITGNQAVTAAALGMNKATMNQWANSQWFKELTQEVKNEGRIQLSNKLQTIASKAMDVTMDRLENGEWIYDQKTGEMRRKPMQGRDAHKIAVDFLDKSWEIDDKQTKEVTDDAVAGRLGELAEAFANMAKKTISVEVVDVIAVEKK